MAKRFGICVFAASGVSPFLGLRNMPAGARMELLGIVTLPLLILQALLQSRGCQGFNF